MDENAKTQRDQTRLEYQAILDNASLGIAFTRDRTYLHCNQRLLGRMLAKAIDATDHSKGTVFVMEDITERKSAQDALLRDDDTVSRIGGDEFVVVLPNIRSDAAIAEVARKVLEALSQPYPIEGHTLSVTPSIGISRYPQDAADAETLISRADDAMYQAKRQGRANARFFAPDTAPLR